MIELDSSVWDTYNGPVLIDNILKQAPNVQSDYLRAWLLATQGGVWVDADCVVFRPLDFVYDLSSTWVAYRHLGRVMSALVAGRPESKVIQQYHNRMVEKLATGRTMRELELGPMVLRTAINQTSEPGFVIPSGYVHQGQLDRWGPCARLQEPAGSWAPPVDAYCCMLTHRALGTMRSLTREQLTMSNTVFSAAVDRALNRLISKTFCINLDDKVQRWEQFIEQFDNWPYQPPIRRSGIRAPAPDGYKNSDGCWGCYRAHHRIFEDCLNEPGDSILIMEDDALLCENFAARLREFLSQVPNDWDMLYLGGDHIEPPTRVDDNVVRGNRINCLHAYMIRLKALPRIYRHTSVPNGFEHMDMQLNALHKDLKVYAPTRWLAVQRKNVSGTMRRPRNKWTQRSRRAIVVLDIDNFFPSYARESFEEAAGRWNVDLVVIDEPLADCHVWWQKTHACGQLQGYDHVLQLDADMLIRDDAPNPFDLSPPNKLGIVRPEFKYRRQPFRKLATQWLTWWSTKMGMPKPPLEFYANAGFLMYGPREMKDFFDQWLSHGRKQGFPGERCGDQPVLSVMAFSMQNRIQWLPHEWNMTEALLPALRPDLGRLMSGHIYHFTGQKDKLARLNSTVWRISDASAVACVDGRLQDGTELGSRP